MVLDAAGVGRLPDAPLPAGYVMRAYRPGDEAGWAETLAAAGFTTWDAGRVLEYVEDADRRAGSRLVERAGRIVAATFASRASNRPAGPRAASGSPRAEGVLDYVATRSDHRGRGLGRATCTGVSQYLIEHGCNVVTLSTDDWRLPAIHLYLSMGFRPVMNREDMPARWAEVISRLKEGGREYS